MQAAEEFIAGRSFSIPSAPEDRTDSRLGLGLGGRSAPPRASDIPCSLRRYSKKCAGKEGSVLLWLVKWNSRTDCLNGAGDSRP